MWSKKGILICPACGKPYEFCHWKIVDAYLRHKDKSECDKYSEPETEEHLRGKIDLYEWIKKQDGVTDAVLEGWLPETKQRPDIMFKFHGDQCVIEYQCSPIATEYIERHELYKAAGIRDVWICGTEKYIGCNKQMNYLESVCRTYYDPTVKSLSVLRDLSFNFFIKLRELQHRRTNSCKSPTLLYHKAFRMMKNKYDYVSGYKNFIQIKDQRVSYNNCSYLRNHSFASFYNLNNIRLVNIKEPQHE